MIVLNNYIIMRTGYILIEIGIEKWTNKKDSENGKSFLWMKCFYWVIETDKKWVPLSWCVCVIRKYVTKLSYLFVLLSVCVSALAPKEGSYVCVHGKNMCACVNEVNVLNIKVHFKYYMYYFNTSYVYRTAHSQKSIKREQ